MTKQNTRLCFLFLIAQGKENQKKRTICEKRCYNKEQAANSLLRYKQQELLHLAVI